MLAVLNARGITVPEDTRARIASCADLAQLDIWLTRAATAADIDGILD